MRKKWFSVLLAALMAASLAAGCSGGAQGDASAGSSGSAGGSSAAQGGDEAAGGVTIKMVSTIVSENPEGSLEQECIEKFKAATGNTVECVSINRNDAVKTLLAQATAGNMPDIITMDNAYVGEFADMGLLADIEEVYGREYVDGFDPEALVYCKHNDKVWCVPIFQQYTGLLYRKDWFEEAGLSVPTTWEEFIDAAKALTQDTDGDGTVDRWGFAMVGTNNSSAWGRFFPIYATFGVKELYEQDGKWVSDAGKPESKEAMKFFTDLATEHAVVPVGPLETAYKEALSLMGSGKTAMMVTGTHSLGAVVAASGGTMTGEELAVAPLPKGPSGKTVSTVGVQILSLNKDSKVLQQAADYLKFWNEEENALYFLENTGRLPTRTEVKEKAQALPAMQDLLNAQIDEYYSGATIPAEVDVETAYGEAWQAIITQSKTLDQAMADLETRVNEIIATIEE